ncbi:MAG: hypothetical protein ACI8Y7_000190 [Candidatus Woesearchaeota archaeon]|jgi:hypothetical protein
MAADLSPDLMFIGIIVGLIIGLCAYVYGALTLHFIAKKLNVKNPWMAWIPLANFWTIADSAAINRLWIIAFFAIIPISWIGAIASAFLPLVGFLIAIPLYLIAAAPFTYAWWRIFDRRKLPGALALLLPASYIPLLGILASIALLVVIGIAAFKE